MRAPNEGAMALIGGLAERGFWGVLTLKFQRGQIVHITKEESIQISQNGPDHRRDHAATR
jgi:hypothetical protein